ncbi:MAG: hypothetical protein HYU39_09020 [Thaumarchaeota archaeon]|nr:hypothetical protein [Nitrososphaerota archaeon]
MSHGQLTAKKAGPTRIGSISLKADRDTILVDEPIKLLLRFQIDGGFRDNFTQQVWEEAYKAHDVRLRLTLTIGFAKKVGGVFSRKVGKPIKMVRKAKLFWTRNPERHNRTWVMVIDENEAPMIPKSGAEAQSLLLDFNRSFDLLGTDLGKGTHSIVAKVKAKWGRHYYAPKGSVEATSPPIKIVCT